MKRDLVQKLGFHKCSILNVHIVDGDHKMNFLMVGMLLSKDLSLGKKFQIKNGMILYIIEKV